MRFPWAPLLCLAFIFSMNHASGQTAVVDCELEIKRSPEGVTIQFRPPGLEYASFIHPGLDGAVVTPSSVVEFSHDLIEWRPLSPWIEGGIGVHPEPIRLTAEEPANNTFYRVRLGSVEDVIHQNSRSSVAASSQGAVRSSVRLQSIPTPPSWVRVAVIMTVSDGMEIARKRLEMVIPSFLTNQ